MFNEKKRCKYIRKKKLKILHLFDIEFKNSHISGLKSSVLGWFSAAAAACLDEDLISSLL